MSSISHSIDSHITPDSFKITARHTERWHSFFDVISISCNSAALHGQTGWDINSKGGWLSVGTWVSLITQHQSSWVK